MAHNNFEKIHFFDINLMAFVFFGHFFFSFYLYNFSDIIKKILVAHHIFLTDPVLPGLFYKQLRHSLTFYNRFQWARRAGAPWLWAPRLSLQRGARIQVVLLDLSSWQHC